MQGIVVDDYARSGKGVYVPHGVTLDYRCAMGAGTVVTRTVPSSILVDGILCTTDRFTVRGSV